MLWAFWVCTSFGVFLWLHIIQQVMADTRKPSNFLIKSLGVGWSPLLKSRFGKQSHVSAIPWMYTVRARDRSFLHLWVWLKKRNWKLLWLSFGTRKPLPWVGKQYFIFVLCFWLNQHCLVVRSKKGKRRYNIPSSSKKSFTDCPVDPYTLLFPFACEKMRLVWVKSHVLRSSS